MTGPRFFIFNTIPLLVLRRAHARSCLRAVCVLLLCGTVAGAAGQTVAPDPGAGSTAEKVVTLAPVDVVAQEEDDYDATGLGSVEEELRDQPFANELIAAEDFALDDEDAALASELASIAEPSPAERIAGEQRLALRGFPTPTLRNGFIQVGFPETLNTGQTIVIQGALVPVLGRAAPGGIQNFITARPRTKRQTKVNLLSGSLDRTRAVLETTGPLLPKKGWYRGIVDRSTREGPQEFAAERATAASVGIAWKHSRAASTLFSLDYRDISGIASAGIPEYRPAGATKIAGPYLPLALFNSNGPNAGVRRRSTSIGVQFDGQPRPALALRAGAAAWARHLAQDRFTTSVLDLETGLFQGTREPRHLEQPQRAVALQVEAIGRFRKWRAEHKLMLSASHTWGSSAREERALPMAVRNALPLSVRRFDPTAPDYYFPEFDASVYSRILADREERARFGSLEISDRAAISRGRVVATGGIRYDSVALAVADRRAAAAIPETSDRTAQLSYHAGVNWQAIPSKLLVFATTSTAFDPSTPVDARTGRIQRNETTLGYESGFRGRLSRAKLDYSATGFLLLNQHISRRNPLYNDPIADANGTQPQLVAAGEERFSGARLELRWRAARAVSLAIKANSTRAITTASPDLPQEVGRPVSRLPSYSAQANLQIRPAPAGWYGGVTWQYLDGFVSHHGDVRREKLEYPGYGIAHANAGYAWRREKVNADLNVGIRNLFDRDLLTTNANPAANREITMSARFTF